MFEFNVLKARQIGDLSQQTLAKPLMALLSLSKYSREVLANQLCVFKLATGKLLWPDSSLSG